MNGMPPMKLIECPRDAMQGWKTLIPTALKIEYINSLLQVGFDTIDFGSFVSPKAIPQMADTREVLEGLQWRDSPSKLLAIVANLRGAEEALTHEAIAYLGFPFSISETFQQRNTNSTVAESFQRVEAIQDACTKAGKELVVYISMAFGNPYGDEYAPRIVYEWVQKIAGLGIKTISLADTVGLAEAEQVYSVTHYVTSQLPHIETGVHLHATSLNREDKLEAAFSAGCRRFDGALKGIGGCPMAGNELVGNMNTELMVQYFRQKGVAFSLNEAALEESLLLANSVFS